MAKKKIEQVKPQAPEVLLTEACGCAVYSSASGIKLERCDIHDSGFELITVLANILDSGDDDMHPHLETAEHMLDDLLETHGGRATVKRYEKDGVDSYVETINIKRMQMEI